MKKSAPKKVYRIRNWNAYNNSLKNRGSLEIWIDYAAKGFWYQGDEKQKKRGRQQKYSDVAVQTSLILGTVFHQRLRQTEGLLLSVFRMMGVALDVPDYTTLCRRRDTLTITLPKKTKEHVIVIIDSTGLKVYGEGEWKVRKHGWSKHRTWKKLHLGVDMDGEIRIAELTGNDSTDADVVGDGILDKEDAIIDAFSGDGAYDRRKVYDDIIARGIPDILIPPQKNAKIWQHGNSKNPPHPRDENLRHIRKSTRKRWKEQSGYHIRSLSETAMYRTKTAFGDRLAARKETSQRTEAMIRCAALNTMTYLGMPEGRWVEK